MGDCLGAPCCTPEGVRLACKSSVAPPVTHLCNRTWLKFQSISTRLEGFSSGFRPSLKTTSNCVDGHTFISNCYCQVLPSLNKVVFLSFFHCPICRWVLLNSTTARGRHHLIGQSIFQDKSVKFPKEPTPLIPIPQKNIEGKRERFPR